MALEGKLAAIYMDLWNLNPETVCRYASPREMPNQESAIFMTHLDDREFVAIWIARVPVPSDSLEPDLGHATTEELISLAHERGHEASFHAGTYAVAAMPEEHRAWGHAERLLRERGFDDWTAFADAKAFSLAEHQRRGTREFD